MNSTIIDLKNFINITKKLKRHEVMQLLKEMNYVTYDNIKLKLPLLTPEIFNSLKNLNKEFADSNKLLDIYDKYQIFDKNRSGGGSGSKSGKRPKTQSPRKNTKSPKSKKSKKFKLSDALSNVSDDNAQELLNVAKSIGTDVIAKSIPASAKKGKNLQIIL